MTATRIIPMKEWGKDHWSNLAYIETRIVDHKGYLDSRQLNADGIAYPTRLRRTATGEARQEVGHSDYDCIKDFMATGLLAPAEGTSPGGRVPFHEIEDRTKTLGPIAHWQTTRYVFTPKGLKVAGALRTHKAAGGNFASFIYPVPRVKPAGNPA
jgi:hypothetical protein